MMMNDGKKVTTRMKLTGMITPANKPKLLMGMSGLRRLAKKATEVVLEVKAIALYALRKV